LKRLAALLLLALAALPVCAADYLQAVEFPYYLYPRTLWERELVWLKNIGVDTVAFSIPAGYHSPQPGQFDLTGASSPRRDLVGFVRLLRKLGLRAWVRPQPQQRAWLKQLEQVLATQTVSHGGPIAFVEGRVLAIDAPAPPAPVTTISAVDPAAFERSREAINSARGTLLWTDVEDALYPAGWAANPAALLRHGAVSLSGEEQPATQALRRNAALLHGWARLFPGLHHVALPKPEAGARPEGVSVVELVSLPASAVSIGNASRKLFHDDVRVTDPLTRKTVVMQGASVAPQQSMWFPLGVSLGPDGLCRGCNFSPAENIVYATAELLSMEFENGILAMEFFAPEPGEVILQLARRPTGPFLAAGHPAEFDWDEPHMRARLAIPAGTPPRHRVRIGIAIEAPDTSAFFNDLHRLVIGRGNTVSTTYSSAQLAARSRLRLPEGYTSAATNKSPNEIDYEITVPADAIHGDYADLALEADGVALGRAHVQLFRPATVRLLSGVQLHFGPRTELAPDPPIAAIDPKGGNLEIAIRNNTSQIQTYHLEPVGPGLEFLPPKTDISIGPTDERRVEFRVFPAEGPARVREWTLKVSGGAALSMPMRMMLVPRAGSVGWSADLDGDGAPEWILESAKVRAVFSAEDGGRWMEFTWKDTGANFLAETGLFAQSGPVEVHRDGEALVFIGKGWQRSVTLDGTTLTVEQSTPLPPETLATEKHGNLTLTVARPTATRALYDLK
jgi:hypothetical protein